MRRGAEFGSNFESPEERARQDREGRLAELWRKYHEAHGQMEQLKALEEILSETLAGAENELAQEVALVFLQKLRAKQDFAGIQKHWDDDTYQPLKGLGIFLTHHRKVMRDFYDPKGVMDLNKGDEVLELHLPPVPKEQRTKLRSLTEESFKKIAAYIARHGLTPKYITGITYEAIGRLAPRFGFNARAIPIPEELRESVRRVHASSERADRPLGDIVFVSQDTEIFMKRWGDTKENHETTELPRVGEAYTRADYREGKPLEWKHIALVRVQKEHVPIASKDRLVERTPYRAEVNFRNSVHFTTNHMVSAHEFGSWDEGRCAVVAPGESMREANGIPKVINAIDTYYDKKDVVWPPGTVIIYYAGDAEAEKLRKQHHDTYHFVRLQKGEHLETATNKALERLGYTVIKGGTTYTDDDWFANPLAELGVREGATLTLHSISDEFHRDHFFALEAWKFFKKPEERADILQRGTFLLGQLFEGRRLSHEEREHLFRNVLEAVLMTHPRSLADYEKVSDVERAGLNLRATLHWIVSQKLRDLAAPEGERFPGAERDRDILTRFPREYWELFVHDLDQPWVAWRGDIPREAMDPWRDEKFRPPEGAARAQLLFLAREEFPFLRRGLEDFLGEDQTAEILSALPVELADLRSVASQRLPDEDWA